jgi:hypothetical protein
MNLGIVNRALLNVGQYALTDEDIQQKNTTFELAKQYYIETFLEALSEVEWTGGRKRTPLLRTGRPVMKNTSYQFMYDVPFDCAKPVELQGNAFVVIEDRLLLTDEGRANLLYVSNGKILRPVAFVSCGGPGTIPDMEYLSMGRPWDVYDVTLRAGGPKDFTWPFPPDPEINEDFPDYRLLDYEPKFYEYIEKTLSTKFAMKLSNQPGLHVQLLQEAMLIKQEAVDASRSQRAAKIEPHKWWTEELGL